MQRGKTKLSEQVKTKVSKGSHSSDTYAAFEGNFDKMISTGSTLLDLAISGGRVRGGGIPSGVLVEIFGPSGAGKTVLLSEIAGNVQRMGGAILFHDPEARLNKQFAQLFGLKVDSANYTNPNTIPEVFASVRDWKPTNTNIINGIFADSLAALSTDLEMESGDKYGTRRAKEFSEELRRTCRILAQNNYIMVCSNQVRQNIDAGPYGQKYITPGGESIGFYSSLRLRATKPSKINDAIKIAGKERKRVIGVETEFEVFKNSLWKPYRTAPVTIIFDYGIDDIRQNLQFIKDYTNNTQYTLGGETLANSMELAIEKVEEDPVRVKQLREEVIDLWLEVEAKFDTNRKPKNQ